MGRCLQVMMDCMCEAGDESKSVCWDRSWSISEKLKSTQRWMTRRWIGTFNQDKSTCPGRDVLNDPEKVKDPVSFITAILSLKYKCPITKTVAKAKHGKSVEEFKESCQREAGCLLCCIRWSPLANFVGETPINPCGSGKPCLPENTFVFPGCCDPVGHACFYFWLLLILVCRNLSRLLAM